MDYTTWLSICASIASILGLFFSIIKKENLIIKIMLIVCFIGFSLLSIYIDHLHQELNRRKNIEKSAYELINAKAGNSDLGFVYASLTFLESNKDLYPDTYKRAIEITEAIENSTSIYAEMKAANTMKTILSGIAILNKNK